MSSPIYRLLTLRRSEFLKESYLLLLSRPIDAQGYIYYSARLALGHNKIDILYDLARSPECKLGQPDRDTLRKLLKQNGNIGLKSLFRARPTRNLAALAQLTFALDGTHEERDPFAKDSSSAKMPQEPLQPHTGHSGDLIAPPITAGANESTTPHTRTISECADPLSNPQTPPFVSILVVNWNGASHLEELGESLRRQEHKNFEVIFVDNNSADNSREMAAAHIPNAKIITTPENVGFAEGNNIALDNASADYILLLNNDAVAPPNLISGLLQELLSARKSGVGAVSPKIIFYKPFISIRITSTHPFRIDRESLLAQLGDYKKLIEKTDLSEQRMDHHVMIPERPDELRLELSHVASGPGQLALNGSLIIEINGQKVPFVAQPKDGQILSLAIAAGGIRGTNILNNCGSYITPNGDAGDRGIFEPDLGQLDERTFVDALCGCAALIDRRVLGNFPLFCSEFFAYYEDTELSLRIRSGGWGILYTPKVVVKHKHASSSNDRSSFFKYFIERNRLLFLAIHFPTHLDKELATAMARWHHFISYNRTSPFPDQAMRDFVRLLPSLIDEATALTSRAKRGLVFLRQSSTPRIGIYNEYWNTRGGGELRALRLAVALASFAPVDLISTSSFDVAALATYFDIKLPRNIRSLVVRSFSSEDTRKYLLFVNTTHHSNLVARANKSIYLLSFPHEHITPQALESYDLVLANSRYTESWVKKYWGPFATTEVLYPPIEAPFASRPRDRRESERVILSIGRFFRGGHSKCQLEMVQAFKTLFDSKTATGWKLKLFGSIDRDNTDANDYLNEVRMAAHGYPIDIILNAPRDELSKALTTSSLYWHATGLLQRSQDPESYEHFGMALAEAMGSGCVPIAFFGGGLPEILGETFAQNLYRTLDELCSITKREISSFEGTPQLFARNSELARITADRFSVAKHDSAVADLISHFSLNFSNQKSIRASEIAPGFFAASAKT